MELNSSINTFTKGLNLDSDITMMPEGQYRYAENIRLLTNADGTTGTLQNIDHIRQYNGGIPEDEIIIGTATARLHDNETNGTNECGVVVTKKLLSNNNIYNNIYIVTDFDSVDTKTTSVVRGYLELSNNVSIVTNYESDKVSNIYICDGITPIKVVNLCDTFEDEISDPTRFDITPGCVLLPFSFVNTVKGALPAGSIQYCYQLFNMNGPETTTSALSEVIPLTEYDSAGESVKVKGQMMGEMSGRGCEIKASFMNDGRFNRARIFSIVYLDNLAIPDIYIINEVEIPQTKEYEFIEFSYIDTGASFLSKITIDEFNAMVPFEFNAKSMEKMQNRLFASNIKELTWDVDYDARAYRANTNHKVQLDSSYATQAITGYLSGTGKLYKSATEALGDSGEVIDVPIEHDCINPSNVDVLGAQEYEWQVKSDNTLTRGGAGLNVSYRFTYTELVLSSTTPTNDNIVKDLSINNKTNVTSIHSFYEDGSPCYTYSVPTNGRKIIPNYSDPYVCANYVGYQRDEIYRFGIIFYNRKNIPSPVHWIGDIRMPSISDTYGSSFIKPFHKSKESACYSGAKKELVCYALGVEFKIKNIPSEVLSYEIVRCDRNEADRTVITQGILGALYNFDDWESDTSNFVGNEIRPTPWFSMMNEYRTKYLYDGADYDEMPVRKGYFELVSPEICISKDTVLKNISNNYIQPLYLVNSATTTNISVPQSGGIYNVYETELQENDELFGTLTSYDKGGLCVDMGYGSGHDRRGFAGVFKYYNENSYSSFDSQFFKIQDAIIGRIAPYFLKVDDAKNHAQPIGSVMYTNVSMGGYKQIGAHGVNAVIHIDENLFNPYVELDSLTNACTAIITNIKQNTIPYGGNTYISRQNSVYQSCGCYMACDASYTSDFNTVRCYGGDTYLGVLDYLATSVIQETNDAGKNRENRICCVCYIPLESQINLNLRSDDSYSRGVNGMIGPNLVQNEPIVLPNGSAQKKPYYEYNPVYSSVSGSKQYIPKSIYAEDDKLNQTRIVVSELKTNNEITDSWTKFKFANYLDVDSQYGQVTNLKVFNNRLYFWQDNAVGIAAVNERSLINDNIAELTLGTGGILTRFDYVATLNGSSIVNDKSIVTSASTIYWYDFDKNEICALNGQGLTPLSKQKGVQSYLNTLSRSAKKNAVSFYDKKYNEVWFRIYDRALIYNEQLTAFTSFYTHNPNWFFPFSDKLVTIKDNNLYYLHNIYDVNSEIKEERISKIQFIVNKDITNTKVFDNVMFNADLHDNTNSIPNIIKNITFSTQKQTTKPFNHFDEVNNSSNIDYREDTYRFAIPRETVDNDALHQLNSQSYVGRLRGKYLICDYTFDCNNNKEFKLPYIKTTYRYSKL